MTDWYRLPNKTAAGLILVISRSSRATKITAGKLVNVSLATFGDVSIVKANSQQILHVSLISAIFPGIQNILRVLQHAPHGRNVISRILHKT